MSPFVPICNCMPVIRDVMPAFELFQPTSIESALELLDRHGGSAWVLAGGLDSFDWLKDRIKRPSVVVDLSGIAELKGVRQIGDGLEIGAMTTLTDVVRHPIVKERYSILMKAAEAAASPQIRNQGTIGGQRVTGHPVLVLPGGLVLLPGRRQHLLCGHADGDQSRARDPERRPLCRGQSV
jgi:CO/xanthine dehydrogenase FAD-binding subunit